jgi:uncharacterized membrane-anchored protein
MTKQNKYWFKRRRYGYGWMPVTWQGFLTVIIYISIAVAIAFLLEFVPESAIVQVMALYIIGLVILFNSLLKTVHQHGPKAKWRWGKSTHDNPREDF